MKTDFPTLVKSMRLVLRPDFKALESLEGEPHDQALSDLEKKSAQMIVENGYSEDEFYSLYQEYFIDFSSDNPDEWIIKHDPDNAQIISGK